MFHHDLDQTCWLLVSPVLGLFAFPFVMAWLEESLDHERLTPARAWAAVSTAWAGIRSWSRSAGSRR